MKYHEHGIFIEKIIRFMELEPSIRGGDLVTEPFESLVLKDVSFAYPNANGNVLENLNLVINSAYRSYQDQQEVYDTYFKMYDDNIL